MEAVRPLHLVIPVDVSLHGRTLVARHFGVDRAGISIQCPLAGWTKSMAAESASHGYADAAAGSACASRTDPDSNPGAQPPRGVVTRKLSAVWRPNSGKRSDLDWEAGGGVSILRLEPADEEILTACDNR